MLENDKIDLISQKYDELLIACDSFLNKKIEIKVKQSFEYAIKDFSKNKKKFLIEKMI